MGAIAAFLIISFAGLATLHLYWAFGGTFGVSAAIPEVNGAPVFTPGKAATIVIAIVLAGFSLIALVLGFGVGSAMINTSYTVLTAFIIGSVLVLRAIGEFRYVGFFKRVTGSTFATYDTWLFSPFCLLAGGAFLALATERM